MLERAETPPAPLSTVPFRRDPDYVQRGPLLEEVTSKLSRPAARVALVGLGGIGKSQLAIEYSHQLRTQSPETWVLWLHASNAGRFEQSVRDTLDRLRVRGRKDAKANVFQLLHDWLCDGRNRPWLVVLDNADDGRVLGSAPSVRDWAGYGTTSGQQEKALLEYLPQCDHGKILVTSRSRDAAKELVYWKDIVAIEPMEAEQAAVLLEKKLDRVYDVRDVVALAGALEFMPLAMAQAAAYICQRAGRCSVQEYVEKLGQCDRSEASVLDIDEQDLRRDREANNSIMLTWQISFDHVREVRPSASDPLSLMSFFDRQAIPEALLHKRGSSHLEDEVDRDSRPHATANTSADKHDDKHHNNAEAREPSICNPNASSDPADGFEKDVIMLRNYHFISLTTEATVFEMHKLVQLATKKWLKAKCQLEHWGSQFISNLNDAFPAGDFENWESCRSLFPHATAALHTEVTRGEAMLRKASLLFHSAEYASSTGAYADAEKMEEQSLQARRNILGEGHSDTLTSMNNLAVTYSNQGRLEKAEKVQVKVVEKMKELLGEGHPDTLTNMGNLAGTYWRQGRWGKAEKVQVEVMEKSKEVLGEGHPDTLTSIGNLALTYSNQGRWDQAEKLQEEVMEKSKEALGEGHPDTLMSLNNLAVTYSNQGRWEEAKKLQVEIIKKSKESLGEGHPDTLTRMSNLAVTYSDEGRWEEAEKLEVEIMKKSKESLGEGHPDTLRSMNNLAVTYLNRGWWKEAEKLQAEVVEKRKELLGEGHPDTLKSMGNLASTHWNEERLDDAEKVQVEVMEKMKEALGDGHLGTLTSMNNLASTYSRRGQWDVAEKLQAEVMEEMKQALGEGHPGTLRSMANLAFTFRALGRRQSALDLMRTCVHKSSNALGVDHPGTRAFWGVKTQWEEDVLLTGKEAVGSMGDKPADGEANVIQAPHSVSALGLILAGIVIIVAVFLRQYGGSVMA